MLRVKKDLNLLKLIPKPVALLNFALLPMIGLVILPSWRTSEKRQ